MGWGVEGLGWGPALFWGDGWDGGGGYYIGVPVALFCSLRLFRPWGYKLLGPGRSLNFIRISSDW